MADYLSRQHLAAAVPPALPASVGSGRYQLGGLTIVCVSSAHQLEPALRELRQSMDDFYIGIDLEWRPDFVRGQDNPVAIMQLASRSVCLLLQLRQLGFPWDLQAFLREAHITYVGFNWHQHDEAKLLHSHEWGHRNFGRFVDLRQLANQLRLPHGGLACPAQHVLGVVLPKQKRITLSNWEATHLSLEQIQYAALDAFATHHIHAALQRL